MILRGKYIFGVLVIILGSLIAWIVSITLYSLGKAIENTQKILNILERENTNSNYVPMSSKIKSSNLESPNQTLNDDIKSEIVQKMIKSRIYTLEKQLTDGLLTQEEFDTKKEEILNS